MLNKKVEKIEKQEYINGTENQVDCTIKKLENLRNPESWDNWINSKIEKNTIKWKIKRSEIV